jgi:hypothetical protein
MVIQDGGVVETATKTTPILLQTVDLALYPEGGDLVAGLLNRVYIEARTPAKKAADVAGVVVNAEGSTVGSFRTEHEGRGRFSFVPSEGQTYALRITEPAGITASFPLPPVKADGMVLSSTTDVIGRNKDAVLRLYASKDSVYEIVLTQRNREIVSTLVMLKANHHADITMPVPGDVDGVIVATIYNDTKTPVAERLLFRQPARKLRINIVPDRADYAPGDKVTLRITTTDEGGEPVAAVVGLTVTDSSILEMIEKREQAPRLPVMVLLENDVSDLSDAHVYLDESNPKALLATDLLLGTQGWRRFAAVDPSKFISLFEDAARRALGTRLFWSGVPLAPPSLQEITPGLGFLRGVAVDSTSAYIPGVTIRATNINTGVVIQALTNELGVYEFRAVPPGNYQLTAALPGFQSSSIPGLPVAANRYVRQDFGLTVAPVAEVRVEAGAFLAFNAPAIGQVLQDRRAREFPRVNMMSPVKAAVPAADPDLNAANADAVRDGRVEELQRQPVQGRIAQEGGGRGGRGQLAGVLAQGAVVVRTIREYAHTLRPSWTEGSRTDFTETVYWNAGIKTDASTGSASISFNLSDSVTSFRVLADAFSHNGALGSHTHEVESVMPFSIEPKIPLQVTSGDVIQLPVAMINGLNRDLRNVTIDATTDASIRLAGPTGDFVSLSPKERARRLLGIDVGNRFSGMADLKFDARAGAYRDTVIRKLDVQPSGFPHEKSSGGMLQSNATQVFDFTVPDSMVPGSLAVRVTVYPTPLASMTDALQSLLQQPYGCFEQTSSTSYPMVMAQQYFLTHTGVDPAIIEKAKNLLEASYQRLTGFESRSRGYEWFGADPGHEALTAYGLMQFTDMARVRNVDKAMVERTRAWLLERRDGKGGFNLNSRALDSFGRAPGETTNTYIVWTLIESGEQGLEKEVAAVKAFAQSTSDSYIVALAANILHATGDRAGARQLMDRLARNQNAEGDVRGATTSITRSGGQALAIETTALSALAWLREPEYMVPVQEALRWIAESNRSGRFGSTQSTILALRSIIAYDAANARPKAPGRILVTVDGKPAGTPVAFSANTQDAITMRDLVRELGPGKHTITLQMEGGSPMPFSASVQYHDLLPDSAEEAQIGIQVALRDPQVREGNVTEAIVSITNRSAQVIPSPVAIVGIPGGLEVRHDQLKELVRSGKIDAYEVLGREVVLYWRYLNANYRSDLPLSLVAAIPGSYTGPATRAYLYYTDEHKDWAPGLRVTIASR